MSLVQRRDKFIPTIIDENDGWLYVRSAPPNHVQGKGNNVGDGDGQNKCACIVHAYWLPVVSHKWVHLDKEDKATTSTD